MALIKRYEDLNAWQRAYEVALEVDRLTNESSFDKKWALKDQMLRSSLSISSNIAEGFGRKSKKDFARFLLIAIGSNDELEFAHIGESGETSHPLMTRRRSNRPGNSQAKGPFHHNHSEEQWGSSPHSPQEQVSRHRRST